MYVAWFGSVHRFAEVERIYTVSTRMMRFCMKKSQFTEKPVAYALYPHEGGMRVVEVTRRLGFCHPQWGILI
ncbi:MAG: hypothetical protein OXC41_08750 [Gammaproteobacteria bacterium]|nr:hypothetical protein [Gammaproteobacteria bacterium]